jgi:hypothetical protein
VKRNNETIKSIVSLTVIPPFQNLPRSLERTLLETKFAGDSGLGRIAKQEIHQELVLHAVGGGPGKIQSPINFRLFVVSQSPAIRRNFKSAHTPCNKCSADPTRYRSAAGLAETRSGGDVAAVAAELSPEATAPLLSLRESGRFTKTATRWITSCRGGQAGRAKKQYQKSSVRSTGFHVGR